jgi:hypothetical protein
VVFPVKLPAFLMETYADADEAVFEPFAGSDTTLLAGQRTGRRVRAIELAPVYVDLTTTRWRMLFPEIPVSPALCVVAVPCGWTPADPGFGDAYDIPMPRRHGRYRIPMRASALSAK